MNPVLETSLIIFAITHSTLCLLAIVGAVLKVFATKKSNADKERLLSQLESEINQMIRETRGAKEEPLPTA